MAFWGIEVKPGKPYVFQSDDAGGRLHLSQATLGSGSSNKKSIVECKVGDKNPIYLCSLLPEKLETCALNHEFEEDEEVTFSIIGPHSVHLSGFFYGDNEDQDIHEDCHGCDHEMEIGSEDEDDSIEFDSEDEEDDDDYSEDDLGIYPPSPVPNSGVRIEEIEDDEKPTNENFTSKRAKKKNENSNKQIVAKARTSDPISESEDEDGFPVPASGNKSDTSKSKANLEETKQQSIGQKSQSKSEKTDAALGKNLKRKSVAVSQDEKPARESTENEVKQKKNKKKKVVQKSDGSPENGKPNPDVIEESPVAEIGNDLKPSSEKKKEKKKKKQEKLQENVPTPRSEEKLTDKSGSVSKKQEKKEEAKSLQVRTFPNGLVIEELAMGKPDGKKASPGKKVSVHYIGKLKKNGKIFDSNIGRAPFKFRLGIGQVIKGWDVGVNGMRIGDKRRLTIPPAMGYGAKGAGSDIPPNSWLVFDVELNDVN